MKKKKLKKIKKIRTLWTHRYKNQRFEDKRKKIKHKNKTEE